MAPRETEDNAYANFWGDKQRALWYAMVFSGVVNCIDPQYGRLVTWLQTKNIRASFQTSTCLSPKRYIKSHKQQT